MHTSLLFILAAVLTVTFSQTISTTTFGFGGNQRGQIARRDFRIPQSVAIDVANTKTVKLMCSGKDQIVVVTSIFLTSLIP
jgi:hypothetical protein